MPSPFLTATDCLPATRSGDYLLDGDEDDDGGRECPLKVGLLRWLMTASGRLS